MSNPTARSERTAVSRPDTGTSTARKHSFDEDRTIHHVPSGEFQGDDLKAEHAATKAAITQPETYTAEDDFPDGGLRAWIVVFGVSST